MVVGILVDGAVAAGVSMVPACVPPEQKPKAAADAEGECAVGADGG